MTKRKENTIFHELYVFINKTLSFAIFIQRFGTYLFLLLIEIVNDHTNKEV